jgi:hypothetical protein
MICAILICNIASSGHHIEYVFSTNVALFLYCCSTYLDNRRNSGIKNYYCLKSGTFFWRNRPPNKQQKSKLRHIYWKECFNKELLRALCSNQCNVKVSL